MPATPTCDDAGRFAAFMRNVGDVDELLARLGRRGLVVGVDRRLRLMALLTQFSSQADRWTSDRRCSRPTSCPCWRDDQ